MEARIRDRAPSVVVAAQDHLPAELLEPGAGEAVSPLRRYLAAGGKVVWLGLPPAALVRDSTGRPVAFDLDRTRARIGVPFEAPQGEHGALPTEAGRRWGLERVRLASHAVAPDSAGTVLDELGRAGAFVRRYGEGAPGSGFVFLWGRGYEPGMLTEIRSVAEAGVLRPLDDPIREGAVPDGAGPNGGGMTGSAGSAPGRACPATTR